MKLEFHRGQRWISNTESELGLGFVEKIEGRHITFVFPAADETRVYALNNAPLSRVKYPVDEKIKTESGVIITVTEQLEHNGCIVYRGVDEQGNESHVHELELNSFAQFSHPHDRLFAGQIDKDSYFRLRVETLQHQRRQHASDTYGLSGPRVQLLPHQFYIAHQVALRHAPRVLLADEVGLGKTIEAGLILHQQLLTERVKRVLIIVPETLIHQWLVEMMRRFNLHFSILDAERCDVIEAAEETNPFESAQLVLCSLSFLTENKPRLQQAIDAEWDLMIVDEAHHLSWSEDDVSPEYNCIDQLAQKISGLLLLTATPEQLGIESHFARLRLLDPNRFYDLTTFQQEQDHYRPVNQLVEALIENPQQAQKDAGLLTDLEHYLGENVVAEFEHADDADASVEHLIQSLLDRHGTGRVLFRNTRDAVTGFPQRKLQAYPLTLPAQYQEMMTDHDSEPLARLAQKLHPEIAYIKNDNWLDFDPRVTWLAEWLASHWDEKVLLICAYAETALALEYYVKLKTSSRVAVFHEKLSIIERDRAAAYFADDEDGANILICSEIGSEGRNFQFAHHLILFDLPLNPDLLEQRIGRLDRIGQTQTIQLHLPHFSTGAQARLVDWYHIGLNAFLQVCSVGHRIFEQVEDNLMAGLLAENEIIIAQTFDDLVEQTKVLREDALEAMQQGRDRLLELNSCHKVHAAEVIEEVNFSANALELSRYMENVFDLTGVDQQPHSSHCIIIKPTEHMQDAFPELPEQGMTATYQRTTALSREDVHFLTWEHPMVVATMEMVNSAEFGNATFCAISPPKELQLTAGTLLLEAIFSVNCPAPQHLQIHRYLSANMVRIVISNTGLELTEQLSHDDLNALSERVRKHTANEIIQYARNEIMTLVETAQQLAEPQQKRLIEQALALTGEEAHDDQERLAALAKVNPNIREEEVDQLIVDFLLLKDYLSSAQLKLDAIRIAFVAE